MNWICHMTQTLTPALSTKAHTLDTDLPKRATKQRSVAKHYEYLSVHLMPSSARNCHHRTRLRLP